MPHIPDADRAILDIRKIEEYCLSPTHPRGRHKARVFRQALGIDQRDASWLRERLLNGVREVPGVEVGGDDLGSRWRVDIPVARQDKQAVIRTVWIVRVGERARFVTCWVL